MRSQLLYLLFMLLISNLVLGAASFGNVVSINQNCTSTATTLCFGFALPVGYNHTSLRLMLGSTQTSSINLSNTTTQYTFTGLAHSTTYRVIANTYNGSSASDAGNYTGLNTTGKTNIVTNPVLAKDTVDGLNETTADAVEAINPLIPFVIKISVLALILGGLAMFFTSYFGKGGDFLKFGKGRG